MTGFEASKRPARRQSGRSAGTEGRLSCVAHSPLIPAGEDCPVSGPRKDDESGPDGHAKWLRTDDQPNKMPAGDGRGVGVVGTEGLVGGERPLGSMRVVIADDHPFYRRGLGHLLRAKGIEVLGEVPNAEAAIRLAEATEPEVVIMDLTMPGISGLEATRQLTKRKPPTRVLMVSVSAEEVDVLDAILAGASGYVLKDRPVEEIIAGIRAAAAGQLFISPQIATVLLRRVHEAATAGLDLTSLDLSDRELEVLDLLGEGKTDQEISEALMISPISVRKHTSSILKKLQVENYLRTALRAVRDDRT
jgi:DNA-binding NarL/FixJ family response regulator